MSAMTASLILVAAGERAGPTANRMESQAVCDRVTCERTVPDRTPTTSGARRLVSATSCSIGIHRGGRRDRIRVLIRVLEFAHQPKIGSI